MSKARIATIFGVLLLCSVYLVGWYGARENVKVNNLSLFGETASASFGGGGGGGGGGCFLPGTMIYTSLGQVPIEEISEGVIVDSFSGDTMTRSKVKKVYRVIRDHYYVIQTELDKVKATAEHPFYVGQGQFKEVYSLRAGDTVYILSAGLLKPQKILLIQRVNSPTIAYNLSVDNSHTFFAGGFAVHNKSGSGSGVSTSGVMFVPGGSYTSGPSPSGGSFVAGGPVVSVGTGGGGGGGCTPLYSNCNSAPNSCGMTNPGQRNSCTGVCSAITPAESLCPCVPSGAKIYSECVGSCGNQSRTVTDSCGNPLPNESCVTPVCGACLPDCSQANYVCAGQTFNDANGCGTNNCTGTRTCDYNWKEVAP